VKALRVQFFPAAKQEEANEERTLSISSIPTGKRHQCQGCKYG
jgi:hypothetical protein